MSAKRESSNRKHIVLCGFTHHATPVAIREQISIRTEDLQAATAEICRLPGVLEAVVLSTCNRTEVYAVVEDASQGLHSIENYLTKGGTIKAPGCLKLIRDDAVLHLLRVAAGLDSIVFGENQILGQLRDGLKNATSADCVGPLLNSLFQLALNHGKRVRTEILHGRITDSVGTAAIRMGSQTLADNLNNRKVLIVGAGKMGKLCAGNILDRTNAAKLYIVNRSPQRTIDMRNSRPANDRIDTTQPFEKRHSIAAECDLVIVSTSAPDFVIDAKELADQRNRKEEPIPDTDLLQIAPKNADYSSNPRRLVIIDISVPRTVDPKVADISGISLYNTDDLAELIEQEQSVIDQLKQQAETMAFASLDEYNGWLQSQNSIPTVKLLKQKFEDVRKDRLERIKIPNDAVQHRDIIDKVTREIVNQLLHDPLSSLRAGTPGSQQPDSCAVLQLLFNLKATAADTAAKSTRQ
jgi:glutamyl-tRNA reductase